jgi:hypothetical protein
MDYGPWAMDLLSHHGLSTMDNGLPRNKGCSCHGLWTMGYGLALSPWTMDHGLWGTSKNYKRYGYFHNWLKFIILFR